MAPFESVYAQETAPCGFNFSPKIESEGSKVAHCDMGALDVRYVRKWPRMFPSFEHPFPNTPVLGTLHYVV